MRVLFLSPVPHLGAGCRARIEIFLPYLAAAGIHGRVRPFLSNRLFAMVYRPGRWLRKAVLLLWCCVNRLCDVVRAVRYDAVFIYRECAPVGPPVIEWFLARVLRKPMIYDLDDAIHLPSPTTAGGHGLARWLKCYWKVPAIIRMSRQVVVCNDYLASYVRTIHGRVVMIPTSVETSYFTPRPTHCDASPLVIGWMGTHSTAPYLERIFPVLRRLSQHYDMVARVIGAGRTWDVPGLAIEYRDWSIEREVEDFQSFDIGVYPLGEVEFDKGKTGYKTVQYMAVGVPAVVSDFGRNRELVQDGVNGFLAAAEAEWEVKLRQLLESAALRRQFAKRGRETVERGFSAKVNARWMIAALRAVAGGEPVGPLNGVASQEGHRASRSRMTEYENTEYENTEVAS